MATYQYPTTLAPATCTGSQRVKHSATTMEGYLTHNAHRNVERQHSFDRKPHQNSTHCHHRPGGCHVVAPLIIGEKGLDLLKHQVLLQAPCKCSTWGAGRALEWVFSVNQAVLHGHSSAHPRTQLRQCPTPALPGTCMRPLPCNHRMQMCGLLFQTPEVKAPGHTCLLTAPTRSPTSTQTTTQLLNPCASDHSWTHT